MKDKIYVVTNGEYSDYTICGVFSDEEKAEEFADAFGYDNVEEYELNPEFKIEKSVWKVRLGWDSQKYPEAKTCDYLRGREKINTVRYDDSSYCMSDACCVFILETDSAKRAIKIASERLAIIKSCPYLFPRLREKCIMDGFGYYEYPTYNFVTKEEIKID